VGGAVKKYEKKLLDEMRELLDRAIASPFEPAERAAAAAILDSLSDACGLVREHAPQAGAWKDTHEILTRLTK
jgi:hypothetical protein